MLVIGCSTGYYFLVSLPQHNKAKLEWKQQYDESLLEWEKNLEDIAQIEKQQKKELLDTCLAKADEQLRKDINNSPSIGTTRFVSSLNQQRKDNCFKLYPLK